MLIISRGESVTDAEDAKMIMEIQLLINNMIDNCQIDYDSVDICVSNTLHILHTYTVVMLCKDLIKVVMFVKRSYPEIFFKLREAINCNLL